MIEPAGPALPYRLDVGVSARASPVVRTGFFGPPFAPELQALIAAWMAHAPASDPNTIEMFLVCICDDSSWDEGAGPSLLMTGEARRLSRSQRIDWAWETTVCRP